MFTKLCGVHRHADAALGRNPLAVVQGSAAWPQREVGMIDCSLS
jgi:hypothetical protein